MSVFIIGVDPGDSTGVGIIKDGTLWKAFQGTPADALTLIELTITHFDENENEVAIACERYVSMQSRGRTHQPTAQRIGGAIENLAERHKRKFVWQGPADAWAIASNALLTQLGWLQTNLTVGQKDATDANMALRHALLYIARTYATQFDTLLRSCGWLPK
jgi:hypothetical protein